MSFDALYADLQPRIRRYLGRLVGATEADDLTQEVFARVDRALPGFRGESAASTWVYRIATHVAYDHLRSRRADRAASPAVLDRLRDPAPGADAALARAAMSDCVRRYIEELPPGYRAVLLLSEDEQLTDQEIAAALGVSVATVKIRLHRARARLKRTFTRLCDRDGADEPTCKPGVAGVTWRG